MRRWSVVLLAIGACYAPHATTGAVCEPAAPICPDGQTCEPAAGGGYACTDGSGFVAVDAPQQRDAPQPRDAPASTAKWTLVQTPASMDVTLPVAPTGAGNMLIVAIETGAASSVNGVSDDAGSTYKPVPNGRSSSTLNGADLGVELWYAPNTKAGATTISVDAPNYSSLVAWEVSGLRQTAAVDAVATLNDQDASMLPSGAAITTTATGDFVVSVAIVAHSVDGLVGTTFTTDNTTYGNGWAHVTADDAPPDRYQAQWTQPVSGGSCASSVAFFVQN